MRFVKRDFFINSYKLGDGVVGQVGVQKAPILLTKQNDVKIQTATTSTDAPYLYTFPLMFQDKLFGVIEIGSFKEFSKINIEFLESSAKAIATSLSTAMQNNKVQQLFEETQLANERLQIQQASAQKPYDPTPIISSLDNVKTRSKDNKQFAFVDAK